MALKVKKNNVEQTINLKEKLGIDFRGKDNLKQLLGQAIVDRIVERSQEGNGVNLKPNGSGRNVKLKSPYSKAYADSLDFKAAGKKRDKVNMTLTGDMLGLLDIKKVQGNSITIGWDDAEQNGKAHRHMTGDGVPKRPFFGVSNKELKDIAKDLDIKKALRVREDEGKEAFNSLVLGLLDELDGNES